MTEQGPQEQPEFSPIEQLPDETPAEAVATARADLTELAGEARGQLTTGARALTTRTRASATAYVAAGEGWLDRALRGVLLGVPPVGGLALINTEPRLLWVAVPAGLVVVWRAGADEGPAVAAPEPAEEQNEQAPEHDGEPSVGVPVEDAPDGPAEDPAATPDSPSPEQFVALVRDLLGEDGTGVHLVEVAARLRLDFPGRSWTPEEVHAAADSAGVPRATTRSRTRRGATTGIRARDLPPLPSAPTDPRGSVVDAGQRVNNNINNSSTARAERHGDGMTIIRAADATTRHTTVQPR